MIKNFDEVFSRIKASSNKIVAVAAAEDEPVLEAINYCRIHDLADAILVGK